MRGPHGIADWSGVASRRRIEPCTRFSLYHPDEWNELFVASAGASATLVVVAISSTSSAFSPTRLPERGQVTPLAGAVNRCSFDAASGGT